MKLKKIKLEFINTILKIKQQLKLKPNLRNKQFISQVLNRDYNVHYEYIEFLKDFKLLLENSTLRNYKYYFQIEDIKNFLNKYQ